MNKTCTLVLFASLLVACDKSHEKAAGDSGSSGAKRTSAEFPSTECPLMIKDVIRDRERLLGKNVTVVACLLTHFEGPWICEHPDAPFVKSMSLELPDGCKLISKNGTTELDWLEDNKGYAVVIVGTLKSHKKRPAYELEDRLYIEVVTARELAVDDPVWKNYAQQFKKQGEQSADGKPPEAAQPPH